MLRLVVAAVITSAGAAWVLSPSPAEQAATLPPAAEYTASLTLRHDPNAPESMPYVLALLSQGVVPERVVARIGFPGSAEELAELVTTDTSTADDVLVLDVTHPDPDVARAAAEGFAEELVAYLGEQRTARSKAATAALLADLGQVKESIAHLTGQAADAPDDKLLAASLQSERESYRRIYSQLQAARTADTSSPSTIDSAVQIVGRSPGGLATATPRPLRVLLTALAALAVAVLAAVGVGALDRRLRTPAAVQEVFGLPILARLSAPAWPGRLVAVDDPDSRTAAALRTVGALLTDPRAGPAEPRARVVAITSPSAWSHATWVTAELAAIFVERGLDTVLAASDEQVSRAQAVSRTAGVRFVALGSEATAPPERVRAIVAETTDQADVVLIEAPPLDAPAAVSVALAAADEVVVVVGLGDVDRGEGRDATRLLSRLRARSAGLLVVGPPEPGPLTGRRGARAWAGRVSRSLRQTVGSVGSITAAATVLAPLGYAVLLALTMNARSYDLWGSLVLAPVLALISLPILRAIARVEGRPAIFGILVFAMLLKLAAGGARYWMAFVYYEGSDALGYHLAGVELSALYRQGIFTTGGRELSNTAFMEVVSGFVYTVIGPTMVGGFVVFAWLSFWGLVMLWRAFRIGFPEGDHRRYSLLVLFLPSMLFWPSALGKEAFMTLAIGACALGAARLLAGRSGWLIPLGAGLLGTTFMRPHFTAMLVCGVFAGFLFRRPVRRTPMTPLIKGGGIVVLLVVGLLVARQAASFLGVDASVEGVQQALATTAERTELGGSSFQARPVRGPQDLPWAFVTVGFRPFPWEANNVQAALQALESAVILALFVLSWRRVRTVGRRIRSHPYVAFCLVYALLFVYAYSTYGNFGLLARQRVLLYPFLLILVCVPPDTARRVGRTGSRTVIDPMPERNSRHPIRR